MDSLSDDPTRGMVKRARWSLEDFRLTVERLNNPDLLPDPRDTDDLVALVDQEDLLEPLLNPPRYSLDFSLPDALIRDESLMGRWNRLFAEFLRTSSGTFDEAVRLESILGYYERTFRILADALILANKPTDSGAVFDGLRDLQFQLVLARPPYEPAPLRSRLNVLQHESMDTVWRVLERTEAVAYAILAECRGRGPEMLDRRGQLDALIREAWLKHEVKLTRKALFAAAGVSRDTFERFLRGEHVREADSLTKLLALPTGDLLDFIRSRNPTGL